MEAVNFFIGNSLRLRARVPPALSTGWFTVEIFKLKGLRTLWDKSAVLEEDSIFVTPHQNGDNRRSLRTTMQFAYFQKYNVETFWAGLWPAIECVFLFSWWQNSADRFVGKTDVPGNIVSSVMPKRMNTMQDTHELLDSGSYFVSSELAFVAGDANALTYRHESSIRLVGKERPLSFECHRLSPWSFTQYFGTLIRSRTLQEPLPKCRTNIEFLDEVAGPICHGYCFPFVLLMGWEQFVRATKIGSMYGI